jgi:hypothetical protein
MERKYLTGRANFSYCSRPMLKKIKNQAKCHTKGTDLSAHEGAVERLKLLLRARDL